ncbi:hypothetical protein ACTA71_012472 [Dictyostelium dimigraforme]
MVKPKTIQHRNDGYNARLDLTRATLHYLTDSGHGGKGYSKYPEEVQNDIEDLLFETIIEDPLLRVAEIKRKLENHNVSLSATSIKGIFKKWKWSFKKPDMKQINIRNPISVTINHF